MNAMFQIIDPESIVGNTFKMLDKDWMLITPGTITSFNPMTASWGGFGILWHKPVAYCFIRPQRYTYKIMEENSIYTLSFFTEEYRNILDFCGTRSGKHYDKVKSTGLKPWPTGSGGVGFEQANLVLECRKMYWSDIDPGHFLIGDIQKNYPSHDYHRLYIGEITKCYRKE